MPPKAKFTREQIINAALEIVRQEGMESLSARRLAKKLNSSSCPIFTVFANMDEVRLAVQEVAKARYKEYVERGLADAPAFKGVGKQYILFAVREPKLFQLLFMSEQSSAPGIDMVLPLIEESYGDILASIIREYGLERNAAERLYRHLWIYTHGIATLSATKMCSFTGEEISRMMTDVFVALLKNVKEESYGND